MLGCRSGTPERSRNLREVVIFHPDLVAIELAKYRRTKGARLQTGDFQRLSIETCQSFTTRLAECRDPDTGESLRPLTEDEEAFILNEWWLARADWKYWAERYVKILKGGEKLESLYPIWESQQVILDGLAKRQLQQTRVEFPDGVMVVVSKARQLGASTLIQAVIAHRVTLFPHKAALIAGDVPDQSSYLFSMAERLIDRLPWWLKPATLSHRRGQSITFDNGSFIKTEAGKSMRGALQKKGGLGTGRTYVASHLSEIAKWEHPEQIEPEFLPAVPIAADVFCALESTAQQRHDYWHDTWNAAMTGIGRFSPIFIPWYTEVTKHRLSPPEGWEPRPSTLAHARRAEQYGPRWVGRPVRLAKEQLYFYEQMRIAADVREAKKPGAMADFLKNYPAEPEESFQHAGRSIFGHKILERIQTQQKPLQDAWLIAPDRVRAEYLYGELGHE